MRGSPGSPAASNRGDVLVDVFVAGRCSTVVTIDIDTGNAVRAGSDVGIAGVAVRVTGHSCGPGLLGLVLALA